MGVPFLDLVAVYREDASDYDAAYHRVMNRGRWILGPELTAFEAAFARHCGVRHAIGVGNGLDALRMALSAAGVGPGDEVVVPAHTFIATWLAVQQCGAVPVPVEPVAGGFGINASGVAAAITPRTRAVIPVHLYGHAADPAALRTLCDARGLVLVEDAAQAHGALHAGRRVGSFGSMAAFSFYPGKNLGAFGDAGAVVTDDDALAAALRSHRNYGSSARYVHDELGTNSRLDELQAAWLAVRLARLDEHNQRRSLVADHYGQRLAGLPGLQLPATTDGDQPVWHLYVVRTAQRDALQAALATQGIETLVHYPRPVYRFAPFASLGPAGRSPSDALCDEILSLPIGPHMNLEDAERVCVAVRGFFEAVRPGAMA
ncbi:DegT/DnrJ/EryC1/StrS family aminotransferase [Ideonella sp.]|uniref:DegT/DnrJ/EryC1/StrS family aminotransferase n=1 Tax=Ideonella sp. TaxID=1929293 RepID=UPI003BB7F957